MKPIHLTICGWGPYKGLEEIDFRAFDRKGMFLITGPTGAGKTTVFDAISYALYGSLSGNERDKERSSVRSDFAEVDTATYVELEMLHGGSHYRIRRNPEYLRPKKRAAGETSFTKEKENAILYYPDGKVVEGVREVNAALREILVLDYDQFKKISMIAQGEFARLLVAPPKEKTQIFREIFGTGMYDRFTQELGTKARAIYAKVSTVRSKLEEDLKILVADLDVTPWEEELKVEFTQLVKAENINFGEVQTALENMLKAAAEGKEKALKEWKKWDKEVEKAATGLTRMEEENNRILHYLRISEERQRLKEEAPLFADKQERLKKAMNAGWVEAAEAGKLQLERQLEKTVTETRKELGRQMEESVKCLEQYQGAYLKQEESRNNARKAWEEAEHSRRLDAIGLAAELLEPGEPCPVCGALEHPHPAKSLSNEHITEAQLEQLKKLWDREEKLLLSVHEKGVAERSRLEELSRQQDRLEQTEKQLREELKNAEEKLEAALKQYGFEDWEAYRSAKMSEQMRLTLSKEIESYQARLSANEELYRHLSENISDTIPLDLTPQRMIMQQAREERERAQKNQKQWEKSYADGERTAKMLREKLALIEAESREYGYVKDLENLASGNNPKRLVFEQFVLAGYFEEILEAANLRFRKMTGGRYEMSRVLQVGDGRVKDNLEIRVMDYYTGKFRSARTLSGGESFKASLALALGMSDVIQAMNGGIKVDALFVDEGFGALDEESLDQACNTLMSLVDHNRIIGIISHVPELRERIEQQLIIDKTANGSRIRVKEA